MLIKLYNEEYRYFYHNYILVFSGLQISFLNGSTCTPEFNIKVYLYYQFQLQGVPVLPNSVPGSTRNGQKIILTMELN